MSDLQCRRLASRMQWSRCDCSGHWARRNRPWRKYAGMVWKTIQAMTAPINGMESPTPDGRSSMRYVDEFRDPELITKPSEEIRRLADPRRHYRIMEVCGGHTHAI